MLSKFSILFFSLLTICTALSGQGKFKSGYIVTNDNDTIRGKLLSKTDTELHFEVSFDSGDTNAEIESYNVSNLLGFGFASGRTFERINYSDNKTDTVMVFAKKILTGKIDTWLYRQSLKGNPSFFLKNTDNQKFVHFSKIKDKALYIDQVSYSHASNKHVGLMKYVSDNELYATSRESKSRYSEKSITKSINKYNQRYSEEFSTSIYKEEIEFKHRVFVGRPVFTNLNATQLTAGYIRRKVRPEKNPNVSQIMSISYTGSYRPLGYDEAFEQNLRSPNGDLLLRSAHVINVMPLGGYIQGKHTLVKPYAYLGVGLTGVMFSFYDFKNEDSKNVYILLPNLIAGAGFEVRIGSYYLFSQVSSSLVGGLAVSVGVEF